MLIKNPDEMREITVRPFAELKCDICGTKAVPTAENQFLLSGGTVRCKKCWYSTKKAADDEQEKNISQT